MPARPRRHTNSALAAPAVRPPPRGGVLDGRTLRPQPDPPLGYPPAGGPLDGRSRPRVRGTPPGAPAGGGARWPPAPVVPRLDAAQDEARRLAAALETRSTRSSLARGPPFGPPLRGGIRRPAAPAAQPIPACAATWPPEATGGAGLPSPPPPTFPARRRPPPYRCTFFSTAEPDLRAWVAAADAAVPSLLGRVLDPAAPPLVRLYESRTTGRGVELAPGAWVPKGTPLGLYFGDICRSPASDEYALELGRFWRRGQPFDLVVDAAAACRSPAPSPANVALYAHSCLDYTVTLSAVRVGPLPCTLARARYDLRGGQALTWNYDGRQRGTAYTFTGPDLALLGALGHSAVPCACRSPAPCPRSRWLRVFDSA